MRTLILALLLLVGCGSGPREWHQGDSCLPSDCGEMYCTSQVLKDGTTTAPMCEPVCAAGADCSTHCCLPLTGFDVWTCAEAAACAI